MNVVRQRKLEARARRQESLHGITVEKTNIQVPQPSNFPVNEVVKVGKSLSKELKKEMPSIKKTVIKSPVVAEIAKRGPGRPRKVVSDLIKNKNAMAKGNKKPASAKGKR